MSNSTAHLVVREPMTPGLLTFMTNPPHQFSCRQAFPTDSWSVRKGVEGGQGHIWSMTSATISALYWHFRCQRGKGGTGIQLVECPETNVKHGPLCVFVSVVIVPMNNEDLHCWAKWLLTDFGRFNSFIKGLMANCQDRLWTEGAPWQNPGAHQ